jgi:hypothetical protein
LGGFYWSCTAVAQNSDLSRKPVALSKTLVQESVLSNILSQLKRLVRVRSQCVGVVGIWCEGSV